MNNPCYHLTGYGSKIQVVFLQTKIRTLERVINTSFHCVQAAHPQLELALRRIFIDYRGGGFCVFQSYKSVEKNWGMGTEEIGTLACCCKIAVIL